MGEAGVAGRVSRGLAWPMRVDHRGSIALEVGVADIERSIHAILATAPGERLMHLDFGCRIWQHLDAGTIAAAGDSVREALARWEPRIVVDQVTVAPIPAPGDGGATLVSRRAGEERPLTGVDVDIAFAERATGAPSTITFRCVVLADGDHIVREAPCGDEHSAEPDRIPRGRWRRHVDADDLVELYHTPGLSLSSEDPASASGNDGP